MKVTMVLQNNTETLKELLKCKILNDVKLTNAQTNIPAIAARTRLMPNKGQALKTALNTTSSLFSIEMYTVPG